MMRTSLYACLLAVAALSLLVIPDAYAGHKKSDWPGYDPTPIDIDEFCANADPPCETEDIIITENVHRGVNGTVILEQREVEATFTRFPHKSLDCDNPFDLTRQMDKHAYQYEEGIIRWDAKFDGPKVLPDLQKVIDSGAERLCITIVLDIDWTPFAHGYPRNLDIESKDGRTIGHIRESVMNLLDREGVEIEDPCIIPRFMICASIPASFLDDIVSHGDVANVDVYGKGVWVPKHILDGFPTKIDPTIYKEIDLGVKHCINRTYHTTFEDLYERQSLVPPENLPHPTRIPHWLGFENPFLLPVGSEITIYEDERDYCELDKNARGEDAFKINIFLFSLIDPALKEEVVDFIESNDGIVLDGSYSTISALVTPDMLPELEKFDQVHSMWSGNIRIGSTEITEHKYRLNLINADEKSLGRMYSTCKHWLIVPCPHEHGTREDVWLAHSNYTIDELAQRGHITKRIDGVDVITGYWDKDDNGKLKVRTSGGYLERNDTVVTAWQKDSFVWPEADPLPVGMERLYRNGAAAGTWSWPVNPPVPDGVQVDMQGDSAIINATLGIIPKSLPLSGEILGKNTTVYVNGHRVDNHKVVPDDNSDSLLLLWPDRKEVTHDGGQSHLSQQTTPTLGSEPMADDTEKPSLSRQETPGDAVSCPDDRSPVMFRDDVICIKESTIQRMLQRGLNVTALG